MAIAYQTEAHAQTAGTGATSLAISKPSGTVDGDLLIAVFAIHTGGYDVSTLSGWTQRQSSGGIWVFDKIASSEGSSYTWNFLGSNRANGVILRVSGQDTTPFDQDSTASVSGDSTPSYAMGVTPNQGNSFYLFAIRGAGVTEDGFPSFTAASYAMATDNPTWTEVADVNYTEAPFFGLAIAVATRNSPNATGAFSATLSGTVSNSTGYIGIWEAAPESVNPTPSVINATLTIPSPSVAGDGNVSVSAITSSLAIVDPTVTMPADMWTETAKNTTMWTETPKP